MNRLRDLREDMDLNQEDIAVILHTSQVQYSRYETGLRYMPIYHLEVLAKFYNTSIDYIVGLTNVKIPYPRNKNNITKEKVTIK